MIYVIYVLLLLYLLITSYYTRYEHDITNQPLVILFSTKYREWNNVCDNHLKMIEYIADGRECVIGIHCWKEENTPSEPPESLRKYRYKMTTTTQIPVKYDFMGEHIAYEYIRQSTKLALENAESLYYEIYKRNMPMNQPIIRLRPDAYIGEIERLPIITNLENYYISTWNYGHRKYSKDSPETGDIFCMTDKQALLAITNTDPTSYENIINKRREKYKVAVPEHFLFQILDHHNVSIINIQSLKIGICRSRDNIHFMTH